MFLSICIYIGTYIKRNYLSAFQWLSLDGDFYNYSPSPRFLEGVLFYFKKNNSEQYYFNQKKLLKNNTTVEKYGETIFEYQLPKVLFIFYILSWKIYASKIS